MQNKVYLIYCAFEWIMGIEITLKGAVTDPLWWFEAHNDFVLFGNEM